MEKMFNDFMKFIFLSDEDMVSKLKLVNAYTSNKDKVPSEFLCTVLKTYNFSKTAAIIKKYKELFNLFFETDAGQESYHELLDDLIYPRQNMKLFYLLINQIGLPQNEYLKSRLCSSSFFAKNLKAYKIIENSMNEEVDLSAIFNLMKNSTPAIVDNNSSGHSLQPSLKEMFDHIIVNKKNNDQLIFLNEEFNITSSSMKDFVAKFIIENIHSWDFIYYLNDDIRRDYKEQIAEKIQFLLLHSNKKSRNLIPLITEQSLIDEDSFNYEFLYKENNLCLLKAINPSFFDNANNIHFYGQLIDFIVNDVKTFKCAYKFVKSFLDEKDECKLEYKKIVIGKYLLTLWVPEEESYEDKMANHDTYKFFIENIGDDLFKERLKETSLIQRKSLIESWMLSEDLDVSEAPIRKRRI